MAKAKAKAKTTLFGGFAAETVVGPGSVKLHSSKTKATIDALIADWTPDMGVDRKKLAASYRWSLKQVGRPIDDVLTDPAGKKHLKIHADYFEARAKLARQAVDRRWLTEYVRGLRQAIGVKNG